MSRKIIYFFLFSLIITSSSWAQSKSDSLSIVQAEWKSTSLAEGMVFKHLQIANLYKGPQNICMLEIDPKKYSFKILKNNKRELPSQRACETGALAAINGSFFNMDKGYSVCFLQLNGYIIDTTEKGEIYPMVNGAIKIKKGRLKIIDWNQSIEKKQILKVEKESKKDISIIASLPKLMSNYKIDLYPIVLKRFSEQKHPRSIVFTKNGKMYFAVFDGRSEENAIGVNIKELQHFLKIFGAKDALNLDGGGSSTLWISDVFYMISNKQTGVLNMPSDNDNFDHAGEREVANEICIYKK